MAGEKKQVLIIEDNAVNARLLTLYIEAAGFSVLHAADGHTGIRMAAETPDVSIILLDRIMPDMDGLDVLRALKTAEASWHIPVIMLTAALSRQQIEEARLTGAFDCLPKPYDKEKIIGAINDALNS